MKNLLAVPYKAILFSFLLLASCSSEDGADGTNGRDGTDGSNGSNGLNSLITTLIEQPGANCANGGYRIDVGLDDNSNGTLDADEIDATEYLCNGDTSGLAFESYVSLISQTGTGDPTTTVLENSLGLTIVWTRESQGKYVGALDRTIDIGKTVIFYTTPTTHTGVRGEVVGDNEVRIELQNGINAFADDFSNLSFELREYE